MKKSTITIALLLSGTIIFSHCSSNTESKTTEVKTVAEPAKPTDAALAKKGKYLVEIIGCNHCHSPKKMGPNGPEIISELLLSGFPSDRPMVTFDSKLVKSSGFAMFYPDLTAAAGPWGVSFAGNLTPDATGTGSWTFEQFKTALTKGKFKGLDGGRTLLPPMPWQGFAAMTDEDIQSIWAYLKSIPPVKNMVPSPITPDKM